MWIPCRFLKVLLFTDMKQSNIKSVRPITSSMESLLMECHERELMRQAPCDALTTSARGLIIRGLVIVKNYKNEFGKWIMSIYLSEAGRRILRDLQSN